MKLKKPKKYKKCPRCGNKCLIAQESCEECGLIFSRLQFASNKAAKRKILHFDRDFVIYTNQYPKDVSWWKLILYTFLFGLVGGHYYYVGKYVKGGLMTAGFIYLIFCTIFNAELSAVLEAGAYIPIGVLAISWIVSLIFVCSKKFKVPVIVEIPEQQLEYGRAQIQKIREEIKSETAKLKEEKSNVQKSKTVAQKKTQNKRKEK